MKLISHQNKRQEAKFNAKPFYTRWRIIIGRLYNKAFVHKNIFKSKSEITRLRKKRYKLNKNKNPKSYASRYGERLIKRDGAICQICRKPVKKGVDLTVDHKWPLSKGGSNRMYNLQILCKKCNEKKADSIL